MRSPSLLKALALTAVLLSCCACPLVESRGRGSSSPSSSVKAAPQDSDLRTNPTLQSTELKDDISAMESREVTQQAAEELPTNTLIDSSRLCYILGESKGRAGGRLFYEKGQQYAEILTRREPSRVEGHYWLALNLCGMADTSRAALALKLIPVIVGELELALSSDETYDQAGPHRVIGRIYSEAPDWPLSEGDISKSLQHLRKAVEISPENSTNHLYLAETLMRLGRAEEAYGELERVLKCLQHTLLADGLEEDHKQAARLIAQIMEGEMLPGETQAGLGH